MKRILLSTVTTLGLVGLAPAAFADDAREILQSMSNYMAAQKNFTIVFNSDVEVVTNDLQKIQFTSSGQVAVTRPNKLHAVRNGEFADVEMLFDGKSMTILAKEAQLYAQLDAQITIDELVAMVESRGYQLPGADLILSDVATALGSEIRDAKHIGTGVINGKECEHLAFRNEETDWQLWVRTGPEPTPCKYVITTKAVTGAPQYTVSIVSWTNDVSDSFRMNLPETSKKVDLSALPHIDEVPEGVAK
jgi:hypothetical protein